MNKLDFHPEKEFHDQQVKEDQLSYISNITELWTFVNCPECKYLIEYFDKDKWGENCGKCGKSYDYLIEIQKKYNELTNMVDDVDVYKILKKFVIDEVHGADFDQGNSIKDTLSILKKWWNNNKNKFTK